MDSLPTCLPKEWQEATLLGRIDRGDGPTPVIVRHGRVEDLSRIAPTIADLLNSFVLGQAIPEGNDLGLLTSLYLSPRSALTANPRQPQLLTPIDLAVDHAGLSCRARSQYRNCCDNEQ